MDWYSPFAKHRGKIYPLELQEQVIAHFAANPQVKVFLFEVVKASRKCLTHGLLNILLLFQ